MVRGIAALAVMLGHVRALFFVPYSQALNRNTAVGTVYLLTSLGHQAVLVFFVLSGFFISRSVLDSFRRGRWSWKIFLVNRLTRLLLVLLPGLLLCALWDHFGMHLPSAGEFYYRAIPAFSNQPIAARSSLSAFVGNLFFLQSIYFPSFGSDMPLWSLSYEFWYYLLFPILLIALISRAPLARRLAYALAGAAIILMVGRDISLLFLVWLAGAGVGLLHDLRPELRARTSVAWSTYGCGALGLAGVFVAKVKAPGGVASDFLVAGAFLPVMYVLVQASGSNVNHAYASTAKLLASCSYTLYVVHLPVLIFLRTVMGQVPRWEPDLRHAAYGIALAAMVAAYALIISRFTEARTDALRRRIL